MTSTPPSNSYHIARRVDSGARPLVRNQARIEKSATGSKSNSSNVVIAPLNMHALRQISDNNLQNLHLPNSSPNRVYRQPCSNSLHLPGTSNLPLYDSVHQPGASNIPALNSIDQPGLSNLSPHPSGSHQSSNNSSIKICNVCKRSFKGKRGLNLHLNRNPNCKNSAQQPHNHVPSLPSQVLNTVKSPSTSVESLENMCGDGTNSKVSSHINGFKNGCLNCPRMSIKDHFVSTSTHRIHHSIIPDDVGPVNCNSGNVIYLITCQRCKLQYVGETAQLLRERIAQHASCMRHPEKDHTCRILSEHFNRGACKEARFSVHIIEKLSGNGRLPSHRKNVKGAVDPAITCLRRKKETDWMLKLRTVYPYGLNDRIGDEYMSDRDNFYVCSRFPSLSRLREQYKIRTKTPSSNTFIVDNFIYILNESLRSSLCNTMNLVRVLLSSLKKAHCRILYERLSDYLASKSETFFYTQYFEAALDIVKSKIGRPLITSSAKKSPPSNCCHIKFSNKAHDFINIHKILKNKEVLNSLPSHLVKDSPTVVYQLSDTVRSKLFNYKKFVQDIDVDSFIDNPDILPCDCDHSPFVNHDHGHIISGNLNIVSDHNLRKLISKGPKYREPSPFSYKQAKEDIINGIDECIHNWSTKSGTSKSAFLGWKSMISHLIDLQTTSLRRGKKCKQSIFRNHETKHCLAELQSKYVMVPIDKASNNVAFICKRYYAQVLLEELGLLGNPSPTYTKINQQTPDNIISQHTNELKDKFNITVDKDMSTLPDIYWIPKLHKTPVKFRFIIASKKCTTKTLSKDLSSIFSLFQRQIENYHKKAHFYSGIKSYWIVQNRDPVLQAVRKSCERKTAKCISSFDFSTLYTKIPHDKLIDVLNKIIEFCFKGGTRDKISIHSSRVASWVTRGKESSSIYTKESIYLAVEYLIRNCYFKLGNMLFRQDIGIPMGSDPAPAFANLFLYHYESTWLDSIKKSNNILARKFGQVFRYIDDLLTLNDGNSFESHFKDIYPEELQLNKENADSSSTNFLDLHIQIINQIFTTELFDKRDHFGFNITRLPYRDSNIPHRMFYSSIAAETLRICRASSTSTSASSSIQALVTRMEKQGADVMKMKNSIRKMVSRHHIHNKYGIRGNEFINLVFV